MAVRISDGESAIPTPAHMCRRHRCLACKWMRLADASLDEPLLQRGKIGNEVRPVRRVLQSCVGHPVSGNHLLWRFQVRIEDLRIPDNVGLLHRITIAEAGNRTRLPADDFPQARPDAIS